MICLVIRGRNCANYIADSLKSALKQNVDFRAFVVLDAPKDGAQKYVIKDDRIKTHVHAERKGLCFNMWFGINRAIDVWNLKDEDVIGILDADDKLLRGAFKIVNKRYNNNPNLLLTYGSFIKKTKGRKTKTSKAYPANANVRQWPWRGSHFKTFKVKLFKHLKEDAFKHKGEWLNAASDLALMFPLMELAGLDRCKHISKPIYEWRDSYADSSNSKWQKQCVKIIRSKPKMKRI